METFVPLEPAAESTAPLSEIPRIAVIREGIACVIDSYEVRVLCTDRHGARVGYFGREGDGPGEFDDPRWIERAPNGTIGVADWGRARLLLFRPTGELLSETKIPPVFIPSAPLTESLYGVALVSGEMANVEVDFASGDITWVRRYSRPREVNAPGCDAEPSESLGFGAPAPRGGLLFSACRGQLLVWFSNRDDDVHAEVTPVPTYRRTLPTEADDIGGVEFGEGTSSVTLSSAGTAIGQPYWTATGAKGR